MVVREINDITKLEQTPMFKVDKLLWGTKECPKTYGYLGYKKKDGFYLRMICEEKNPYRSYKKNMDPVYKDSAMEAFFQFFPKSTNETPIYLNFEVNANGAMYAKYGFGRQGRVFLSDEIYKETGVNSVIEKDHWTMSLLIPEKFLKEVCDYLPDGSGKEIYCNFYKISEDPAVEHYISFSPIDSEKPNFHLPVFFAKAEVE